MSIWQIIGYAILLFIVIHLFTGLMRMREGLTSGSAGTATTFNDEIKAKAVLLQDELLISKYRSDYEDILINMENYVNLLILKNVVNLNPETAADVQAINNLQNLITALNSSMKYIDTQ
jgi:hypothetical protein